VERSAETTRDDPDGEYLKRNRWFESGSLQRESVANSKRHVVTVTTGLLVGAQVH